MSTHFHPRPSTSAPQSPVCPGSARPTIRAITPSPPHGLSNPMSKSCSELEKPSQASQGAAEHLFMRPKSVEMLQKNVQTRHAQQGFQGDEVDTNVPVLRRGGAVAGRKSPVKRRHPSKSQRIKPYSTPSAASLRHRILMGDRKDGKEEESGAIKQDASKQPKHHDHNDIDIFAACPDTPTPMTASQKRFAYLPLGTPTPTVYSQSASKPRSRTNAAPRTKSAPILASNRNRQTSNLGHGKPHPIHATRTLNHSGTRLGQRSQANDETQDPSKVAPKHSHSHRPLHVIQQQPNQPSAPVPAIKRARAPGPAPTIPLPRKPLSATSNISIHTARSHRSVFSTLGRDELERKKAVVEEDEGPFGAVGSVAELDGARRSVSSGKDGGEKGGMCGGKGCCGVM
ncbi:hypothetical protein COCMIDRAFT_26478 [Bipolaris oryzae ATCC 44560]|uniref:Uncharacterized protein n=1 Tax=Bipolaris oryzae ATCC 44560 TaxID=930090 RepID=W6Z6D2_COCMI|nr:uncharacterized protein COCMIDRAFT_26478 [Bipolaris oryzae ATCC 44560]EUC45363.1 hypothetical protein COCMIDRAFT_26478 [Bipolaris oryzae ATCC 44560]